MASGSGGGGASNPAVPCAAACESCHSAPGIPFCRVDWSLLCPGCAAVVHANQWIIAVPPNPGPQNPSSAPVVDLSSDSADGAATGGSRRRRGKEKAVMRYREKRKSRRFEKTVRYEGRKVYAEQRQRVDGKFAAEGVPVDCGDVGGVPAGYFEAMPGAGEAAGMDVRGDGEGDLGLGLDLGLFDVGEELRLL